jgi:catechol 2,3-dioxygenase-like lactoylglutathione lyase family enzyme
LPIHQEDAVEGVIAGLLEQFERGKLTRRQLIQSLAMVATAAAAPEAISAAQSTAASKPPIPQAFEPAPWKTVWLDHISYAVSDYRKSTAFYRDLMGWEIANDNGSSQCTLKIGSIGGIIIRNRREPGAAGTSSNGQNGGGNQSQQNRPPITGVINHVSWGIQPWDTDKVKGELEKRGLKPRPDMVGENFKSFHVTDPDGWDLQISNKIKDGPE